MIFTNANIFQFFKKSENQCVLLDNFLMDFNMFWIFLLWFVMIYL